MVFKVKFHKKITLIGKFYSHTKHHLIYNFNVVYMHNVCVFICLCEYMLSADMYTCKFCLISHKNHCWSLFNVPDLLPQDLGGIVLSLPLI